MPRVEKGSLATSSCSGSSRQIGICRGTRQADTDYLHLGTPPRLGHSNEHGVAAAVVQLTSSTLCISGRFNASRSTRCFSCVFAPKTELGKNCQFPFFLKSRPRSVWYVGDGKCTLRVCTSMQLASGFFSREVIHAMSVNTTPACKTARINQETSGYEQGVVQSILMDSSATHYVCLVDHYLRGLFPMTRSKSLTGWLECFRTPTMRCLLSTGMRHRRRLCGSGDGREVFLFVSLGHRADVQFCSSSTWRGVFELFPRAVEDSSQFIHLPGNF